MGYSEDSPPVETTDVVEGAMAKIKAVWANIIANRGSGSLLLVGIEVETLSTEQPLKQLPQLLGRGQI